MNKFDKAALLFETISGPDMNLVRHKIDQVRMSPEYDRLAQLTPTISVTQTQNEIINSFEKLDIYNVKTYKDALAVEIEIKRLDASLKSLPSFNPFFGDAPTEAYKVKKLGEIGVEINGQVVKLEDFTSDKEILSAARKKELKLKIIKWYGEAKQTLAGLLDNYRRLFHNIRTIRFKYASLDIEYWVMLVACVIFVVDLLVSDFQWYRLNPNNGFYNIGFLLIVLITSFMGCFHSFYRTFPARLLSQVKQQLSRDEELLADLDKLCDSVNAKVADKAQTPNDLGLVIKDMAMFKQHRYLNTREIRDYAYNPKEYFYRRYRNWLLAYNICFLVGFVLIIAIIAALEIGFF